MAENIIFFKAENGFEKENKTGNKTWKLRMCSRYYGQVSCAICMWSCLHFRDLRCAASLGYRNRAEIIVLMCEQKPGYRVNLQSQSKLLGHCTVFLPSQCWSNRFANFTAINNIERERETSEKGKTAFSGSCRRLQPQKRT